MNFYTIAIDIDGVIRSFDSEEDINPIPRTVELIKILSLLRNVRLVAWSKRGDQYAREVVDALNLDAYILTCLTKGDITPDITIDDETESNWGKINLIVSPSYQRQPYEPLP